ncbi:helix-turn-helix domain-containing protein [Testudinibacter sp. P80/BLE/0925]
MAKIKINVNKNESESATQCRLILTAFRKGERLTSLEALKRFGCLRLSARIYDLRKQGHDIHSETIKEPSGKHVKQYWLEA